MLNGRKVIAKNHHSKDAQEQYAIEKFVRKTNEEIASELKKRREKRYYGEHIAKEICKMQNKELRIPKLIEQLFDKIAKDLDIIHTEVV